MWVTYTDPPEGNGNGHWQSIPLAQDTNDPTLWTGSLTTTAPSAHLFMVQAVSGVGRVTLDHNLGAYYRHGAIPGPPEPGPAAGRDEPGVHADSTVAGALRRELHRDRRSRRSVTCIDRGGSSGSTSAA